ncbi:hypothetical protein [Pararobbsia alpina]|uniref:AbiU2 domain-containing protein n=1 Tax=Pararobbsia alpina TaxID=621374 RepID=UPI0039A42605
MNNEEWVAELKRQVEAAEQEVTTAVVLHETWKPTVHDSELLARMGESFATNTFGIVRFALRREVLMALLRVWDGEKKAVSVMRIVAELRHPDAVEKLISERTDNQGFFGEHLRHYLPERIECAGELVDKYAKGGECEAVLKKLVRLRNVSLAHRQREPAKATGGDATDDEIEAFYQDTCRIIEHLMSAVRATSMDMSDTAGVYAHHARYFWTAVRGERTTGHPDYREPVRAEDLDLP